VPEQVQHTAINNSSKGDNRFTTSEGADPGPNSKHFCSTLPHTTIPPTILQSTAVAHGNSTQHDLALDSKLFNPVAGHPETIDTLLAIAEKIYG